MNHQKFPGLGDPGMIQARAVAVWGKIPVAVKTEANTQKAVSRSHEVPRGLIVYGGIKAERYWLPGCSEPPGGL